MSGASDESCLCVEIVALTLTHPRSHHHHSAAPYAAADLRPLAMVQSLNLAAIRTTVRVIFREPALALPHAHVRDISELDFAKLRAAGCRGVVFDKDNTLTAPYSNEVYPRLAGALRSCVEAFGADRVAVLSNSAGTPDDPGGVAADALQVVESHLSPQPQP